MKSTLELFDVSSTYLLLDSKPGVRFVSPFSSPPPPQTATHLKLDYILFFPLFFQFLYRQPSVTLLRNGRRSQLICYRVEVVWGSDGSPFFYPFSSNLKNFFSIHFPCRHLVLDDTVHITTRCLVLISYRPYVYRSGSWSVLCGSQGTYDRFPGDPLIHFSDSYLNVYLIFNFLIKGKMFC